jgi:glyoxylase-like metal-dependent hydrolase (beta-lactamase superfamily II)
VSVAEEIVPGVWGVSLGIVNAFILRDETLTLVDTGVSKQSAKLRSAVDEVGGPIANIALTHHHPDHRGGLAAVKGDAQVWVHEIDATVVTGERPEPGPAIGGFGKVAVLALRPLIGALVMGKPTDVAVEHRIAEGAEIPGTGLRAVHTPGHTDGHISYLHAGKRFLFVGDAAQHRSGLGLPNPTFTENMDQAKRTLAKIAELDFDVAVFGHGTVLRGKANAEFRKLADALAATPGASA